MTKYRLSAYAGVYPSMLTRYENGERRPSRDTVVALAQSLNLPPYEESQLLMSLGFLPHLDDEFKEVVARIAGHWLGHRDDANGSSTPTSSATRPANPLP
jgi:transcriptional regulator with XRE-family HTH domain